MNDFDGNNSVNVNFNDEIVNENDNNGDSDNNVTQNLDNDATTANTFHRNNFTARDHLFQAMFSRIALTYDRTFPPFARRFIEFMLLITALSVLFILIYIHLAFVKAPITCLDHFSFEELVNHGDSSLKHVVIRVEILSNPPLNYGLFNSYSKEYDDMSTTAIYDKNSSSLSQSKNVLSQMAMFLNLIHKKCPKGNDNENKDKTENKSDSAKAKENENTDQNQSEGSFYKLFQFPINPIIEKAEYWREKLSVRAMAPFRQTFNDLELFAKSVFTEEKYIMEYSLEYGLLRLSPQTRERLSIPVHFILLDATKDKCFGNALSRFILEEFVGYDQIIIGSLKRLAERQSGKGYVRNVVSGEHYRFVNSWMSRTSYLAAGFIMIIFTLSVSMLLRYSHHQIFVFIVDLLRMLENNLQFSFPAAPLLTVVLALVGMEAIMSEFFNDTSTAFYTILIIWLADQYEAVCCRTYVSKRHWPRYFYLYHFAFYAYHYRFNGQFSGLALLCSWLFIQHSMFFFFHHYELPRLMQGIAVRAIMDSLIVERAENTSLTPTSIYHNEDDDSDMPGGDRRDNNDDDDPGSSTTQSSLRTTNGGVAPRIDDYKPPSQHYAVHEEDSAAPSRPSGENNHSNNNNNTNNNNFTFRLPSNETVPRRKMRFVIKKSYQPPSSVLKKFPNEIDKDQRHLIGAVPSFCKDVLSYIDEIMASCMAENVRGECECNLSEILVDQTYSIIAILITLAGLRDTVNDTFITPSIMTKNTDKTRVDLCSDIESRHYRLINDYVRRKEQERRIMPKVKPFFTVAHSYEHFNCAINRKSLGTTKSKEHGFREKLLFDEKYAIFLKMAHQIYLSVERISSETIAAIYTQMIITMRRQIECNLDPMVCGRIFDVAVKDVITTSTKEVSVDLCLPSLPRRDSVSPDVMGDGVCQQLLFNKCTSDYSSAIIPTNRTMLATMHRVYATLLGTEQSLTNIVYDMIYLSTGLVTDIPNRAMEYLGPITFMAVNYNVWAHLPAIFNIGMVSVTEQSSREIVVTQYDHGLSSSMRDRRQSSDTINDMDDSRIKECTVSVSELSSDLRSYLDTVIIDNEQHLPGVSNDCAIPLFDLFPIDY